MDLSRNRLGDEQSPYLLQHRDNPVWWQPWSVEAFEEARRRDVPVFLSIGYSTCHWCHVMEHESFEDPEVAAALNEGFVSIKVDREERPDVDGLYMEAVQAMNQQGGWPLSVWLTPGGEPFFGATYFPKAQFLNLLVQIGEVWREDRERVLGSGRELTAALARSADRSAAGPLDASLFAGFLDGWDRIADRQRGGRRGAPKFPPAYDIQLLFRIHARTGDARALEIATTTLDAMAAGGIYDHVGGGFHRYSTDERWLVPHFEKMLYDQASLAGAYLDGWLVTRRDEYRLVVIETLDYVLRTLTHPDGGFFSAEDADSEGHEGRFYVWSADELRAELTPAECEALVTAFGVTERGNFEHGTNILHLQPGSSRAARGPLVAHALQRLHAIRERRIRPHLDDKVLADWNGLLIASMARAGRVLHEPRFVTGAQRAARFVLERLDDGEGGLFHRWREGTAAVRGFLDDYANVVHALIELYACDFDTAWLHRARALDERMRTLFANEAGDDLYQSDGRDATVPLRRIESWDNVTPAGRSVAAWNLRRLGELFLDPALHEAAARLFRSTPADIRRAPGAFAFLLGALDHALGGARSVALGGVPDAEGADALLAAFENAYLPNVVLAAGVSGDDALPLLRGRGPRDGRAAAYVCREGACEAPVTDPAEAVRLAAAPPL